MKKPNFTGGRKVTEIGKEKPQVPANFTSEDANLLLDFFASKVDAQLKETTDWTADGSGNVPKLFDYLTLNDFVNIVATNGASIIGKVYALGAYATAPIRIFGLYIAGDEMVIGIHTMTVSGATYTVTHEAKFYDSATVDQKLGALETAINAKITALDNSKQGKLSVSQLAVVNGVAVSQANKDSWSAKQNALTAAQLAVLTGEVFTTALQTKYNGYEQTIATVKATADGAMPKPTTDGLQIISKSGTTIVYKAVVEEPVDYIKDATTTKEIKHIRSA